jgi:hypothetical protein
LQWVRTWSLTVCLGRKREMDIVIISHLCFASTALMQIRKQQVDWNWAPLQWGQLFFIWRISYLYLFMLLLVDRVPFLKLFFKLQENKTWKCSKFQLSLAQLSQRMISNVINVTFIDWKESKIQWKDSSREKIYIIKFSVNSREISNTIILYYYT